MFEVIILIWLCWWISWFWFREATYGKAIAVGNLAVLVNLIARPDGNMVGLLLGVIAGLGLTWWGRYHLGNCWSPGVAPTGKRVTTGPYRWLKHPIYIGYGIALVSTAVATGSTTALIGSFITVAGFTYKSIIEDDLLDRFERIPSDK